MKKHVEDLCSQFVVAAEQELAKICNTAIKSHASGLWLWTGHSIMHAAYRELYWYARLQL